ncbi:LOW QUALITY PROTEIN: G protein-regulated inducer of neurite outgrowth 1 [Sorex fumeus]|uniref:LOW QUALITY PROTEIN: G protein-regulated inducer of neurite outgrowth 1 n=1 Tax=Sorex fumeus TaxID=62283 RepID=UPI0024AC86C4|nr:LOW QUALITY PROTEIN: G protein-regulated inducer of neurite outgrowth 1 [Sorex fumeus]
MRDFRDSSRQTASPALSRRTPAPSPAMDSRHGSPCSEGPGGSSACSALPCTPTQEAAPKATSGLHETSISGTTGISPSGKPTEFSSPEHRNAEKDARNPAGSASAGKEDADASRKADAVLAGQPDSAISGQGETEAGGSLNPGTPRKEGPGPQVKTELGSSSKEETRSPRKEEPRNTEKGLRASSQGAGSASAPKLDPRSPAKSEPGASTAAPQPGPADTAPLGSTTKAASSPSGLTEAGSTGKGALGSSTKDPELPGARDPTSSAKSEVVAERMSKTPCDRQGAPAPSAKSEPARVQNGSPASSGPPAAAGRAETVPPAKEPPGKVSPTSLGSSTTSPPGRTNPESSAKREPVSSDLGEPRGLGSAGASPAGRSPSSEKADPDLPGRGEPGSKGKEAVAVPLAAANPASTAKGVPTALGNTLAGSSGKAPGVPEGNGAQVEPRASGNAEPTTEGQPGTKPPSQGPPPLCAGEAPGALEKEDPGASRQQLPRDPEKVGVAPPGKTDAGQVAPLTLEKTETPAVGQANGKAGASSSSSPRAAAATSGQGRAEPAPAPLTPTPKIPPGPLKSPGAPAAAPRTRDNFTKAPSWDASAPPPREDAGTQAGAQACVSVALSPMSPQDGAGGPAFSFQAAPRVPSPAPGPPSRRDAGLQVSLGAAETRSVATGPMTPQAAAPSAAPPVFPEVRVRPGSALAAAVAPPEAAEPVRDVSWDEKGMTWEVYGAAMEVEVLGMAIQKHLERQIEEHGRQGGPAPPPAARTSGPGRAGSVRAAPPDGAAKRPPGLFRALLQSVRRPRCCSRAGPTAE